MPEAKFCDLPYQSFVIYHIKVLWSTISKFCDLPYQSFVIYHIKVLWSTISKFCDLPYQSFVIYHIKVLWSTISKFCDLPYQSFVIYHIKVLWSTISKTLLNSIRSSRATYFLFYAQVNYFCVLIVNAHYCVQPYVKHTYFHIVMVSALFYTSLVKQARDRSRLCVPPVLSSVLSRVLSRVLLTCFLSTTLNSYIGRISIENV